MILLEMGRGGLPLGFQPRPAKENIDALGEKANHYFPSLFILQPLEKPQSVKFSQR